LFRFAGVLFLMVAATLFWVGASPVAIMLFVLPTYGIWTAFLSMWNDLSLRPPEGFDGGGRLVTIGQSGGYDAADNSAPLTLELVEAINDTVNSMQFVAGVSSFPLVLQVDENQSSIQAEAVTRHFSDLRPRLQLGSLFQEPGPRRRG